MPITALADIKSNFVDITTIPSGQLSGVVLTNGAAPLTANWNAGGFTIRSQNSGDWINVTNLGGLGLTSLVGDGATDNTAAFNALIAFFATNSGKTLYFPAGEYKFFTATAAIAKNHITFRGEGTYNSGAGGGAAGTVWTFTGSGAVNAWSSGNASGLRFQNINFNYSSAGFTGVLFSGDGSTGNALNYSQFDKCWFGSTTVGGPYPANIAVSLDSAVNVVFNDCLFNFLGTAVRGRATVGHATNVITFNNCIFQSYETVAVTDAGEAWSFIGCTFEPNRAGVAAAYTAALATNALGLTFSGCWFGDVTSGSGIWINNSGRGSRIAGNRFAGNASSTAIKFPAGSALGATVVSNYFSLFSGGVDLDTATTGVQISGNRFDSVTSPVYSPYGSGNTDIAAFANTGTGVLDYVRSSTAGTIFAQTADSTTTANTLTTIFGTGIGSLTLPAGVLLPGRYVRIKAGGYVSTADGGVGTKNVIVKLGGVNVINATSGATFQTVLNAGWTIDVTIFCRSAGATGTIMAGGAWSTQIATANPNGLVLGSGTTTVDTTGTLAIEIQFNNGNATGAIRTNYATVELLN